MSSDNIIFTTYIVPILILSAFFITIYFANNYHELTSEDFENISLNNNNTNIMNYDINPKPIKLNQFSLPVKPSPALSNLLNRQAFDLEAPNNLHPMDIMKQQYNNFPANERYPKSYPFMSKCIPETIDIKNSCINDKFKSKNHMPSLNTHWAKTVPEKISDIGDTNAYEKISNRNLKMKALQNPAAINYIPKFL